jgi:Flp pilus assembly protein TadD/peroxiredoxin
MRDENRILSRRSLLKAMGWAPLVLQSAPLHGSAALFGITGNDNRTLQLSDARFIPHYPARSPLEDVLRLVAPGSDEYVTEVYAFEIEKVLKAWSQAFKAPVRDLSALANSIDLAIEASSFVSGKETPLRSGNGIDIVRRKFEAKTIHGRNPLLQNLKSWLEPVSQVETAEFQITSLEALSSAPPTVRLEILYDLVGRRNDEQREERVGSWLTEWARDTSGAWKAHKWEAGEETLTVVHGLMFIDVSAQVLGHIDSYTEQMLRGSDYWRTVLDGACGIDVYGNNGLAAGDFDNDGFDDLYVCQPSGLPNRLYRNRGDGTFEDVTEKAGVGVLDNTSCALFADFENKGRQDLLVVCGSGPLLFLNQGDGTFSLKRDAFQFEHPPQGTFTHAALADYDGDGRLDIYFCLYSYYLGLDQYHYPIPYFDARNGPPNYLLHNEGNGTFADRTKAAGLDAENDRYSFACAWGHATPTGLPDLYIANDFGRANLYRNNGDGTFSPISSEAHVNDPGAGMSASWADIDNDGKQEIYAANMWSAAGQRVAQQEQFHAKAAPAIRALYQQHAGGNALYRNQGDGKFLNASRKAGVEMGRWSWCSDFWDFDHDGYPDLYVANGYISALQPDDLSSFFWRQVVGKSPEDASPSSAYEHGWNALNELIRSDRTWSGFERNVMFANNRDGTFTEVSGAVGLDFGEDSRSFVLADLDHDGRLEVILKNRNAPQLRILHNAAKTLGASVAFRLRGNKSNRDAIGAAVTVGAQTRYLQAGSGFLAQHSKELVFGLGKEEGAVRATVRWPNGPTQEFVGIPANHRIEIEEGSAAFVAKPFAASSAAWDKSGPEPKLDPLPSRIETWLIEPLKAPEFALPDLAGSVRELKSFRGRFVLLNFWAVTAPLSGDELKLLDRHAHQLQVLAVNLDPPVDLQKAQSFVRQQRLPFPVLFATEDIAGVYNIIYRYLFDRRRDLAIPTSFLLDTEGMIVKVYQGGIEPARVLADVGSAPVSQAERMHKALPLRGEIYQDAFARNDFTYGVALFQHGYLDQAAESFQQVVTAKPENAEGYYNLGTLSLRRNDLQKAREYLQQTVKIRPNYPEAWNNLGMIAAQEGSAEEAIQNFQQSLQQRPGYATALVNLGNIYRRQKSFAQAQEALDRAIAIQPDDPEINYNLGMLYAQQGQMQQASDYLARAVALRPDYPEALNNLGVIFVRGQDYAKAEEQFRTCIRVAPKFDQAYFNLARLYAMRSDKQGARQVLQQLLTLQPQNPGAKQALDTLQ